MLVFRHMGRDNPRVNNSIKGMGLAVLLLLVSATMVLTLVAADRFVHHQRLTNQGYTDNLGHYAARAGLNRALHELSKDPDWDPGLLLLPDGDPEAFDFRDPALGCSLEVYNNRLGSGPLVSGDISVPAGRVWVQATGLVNGRPTRQVGGTTTYEAVQPEMVLNYAVFCRAVPLNLDHNNIVIGSYQSVSDDNDPKPDAGFREEALVRAPRGANITGGSQILGFVEVPTIDIEVLGNVSRGIAIVRNGPLHYKFSEPRDYQPLPYGTASGTDLNLAPGPFDRVEVQTGGRLVLGPGSYFINELFIGEDAVVEVVGAGTDDPCVLYLGHSFEVGARAQVNWQRRPRLLQIYTCDTDLFGLDNFHLKEESRSSFVIASRELSLTFEAGAQLFGAVDAQEVTFAGPGARIIYDETLAGQVLQGVPEWLIIR